MKKVSSTAAAVPPILSTMRWITKRISNQKFMINQIKFVCCCGKEPTDRENLITEIATRIAYALPYCEDEDAEVMGWIAEDEDDLVRAAMSIVTLFEDRSA